MSEILVWMQSYWYELGTLFVQCAILATVVWYARRALRTSRSSTEQAELLQSVSSARETSAFGQPQYEESERHPVVYPWHKLVRWLQAPLGS